MAPRTRSRFIQLGVSQFAIMLAGLFTVTTVFWALQPFDVTTGRLIAGGSQ